MDALKRIERLERINQVRNAVHDVTLLQDAPYDPFTAHFYTADGVSDSGAFGVFRGRAEIASLYQTLAMKFRFTVHYKVCGNIEIGQDGKTASAKWVSLEAPNIDGDAVIGALRQETTYVFEGLECLVSHYSQDLAFMVPYEQGWTSKSDRSSHWKP